MLLVMVLSWLSSCIITIGGLIIAPPLKVGFYEGLKLLWRGKKKENMFSGFEGDKFGRSVGGILLMDIFIFLWSLLFIIPGIIKAFSYCLTPFIISDSQGISVTDAITLSRKITYGYKGDIFVFFLSYIGWMLLSILTFGILDLLYVQPYMLTAFAGYYEELKKNALTKGVVTEADFGYPASQ